jgi:hypothetical protein
VWGVELEIAATIAESAESQTTRDMVVEVGASKTSWCRAWISVHTRHPCRQSRRDERRNAGTTYDRSSGERLRKIAVFQSNQWVRVLETAIKGSELLKFDDACGRMMTMIWLH